MTKSAQKLASLAFIGSCVFSVSAALAQTTPSTAPVEETTEATDPVSIDFTLSAVSDYRFRGLSLSNKDPAFQPSITVTHESGFYASVWGSNIADNGGDKVEVDLTVGVSKEIGGFTAGALAVYYQIGRAHV